jgi:hypothetical protein
MQRYAPLQDFQGLQEQVMSLSETVGDLMIQLTELKEAVEQQAPPMVQRQEPIPVADERSAFEEVAEIANSKMDSEEELKDERPNRQSKSKMLSRLRKRDEKAAANVSPGRTRQSAQTDFLSSLALLSPEDKYQVAKLAKK